VANYRCDVGKKINANFFLKFYFLFFKVAVACKNCPCGHIFFVARRSSALVSKMKEETDKTTSVSPPPPPEPTSSRSQSGIRRTERVKRDKPDFYNASEYDKQRKVVFLTMLLSPYM
jgi:hypothetical protein